MCLYPWLLGLLASPLDLFVGLSTSLSLHSPSSNLQRFNRRAHQIAHAARERHGNVSLEAFDSAVEKFGDDPEVAEHVQYLEQLKQAVCVAVLTGLGAGKQCVDTTRASVALAGRVGTVPCYQMCPMT